MYEISYFVLIIGLIHLGYIPLDVTLRLKNDSKKYRWVCHIGPVYVMFAVWGAALLGVGFVLFRMQQAADKFNY